MGHRTASECGPQTGDRRTVSNPGLRLVIAGPHAPHKFSYEIVKFIRICAAADPADCLHSISGTPLCVFFDKGCVARLLYPAGDLIKCAVPGDILPMVRTRASDLRLQKSALVNDFVFKRSALRAERATIDRMVGIALNMHRLRCHIFGFITNGVNNHATADRAIGTSAPSFGGASNLQCLRLRVNRSNAETKCRCADASDDGCL